MFTFWSVRTCLISLNFPIAFDTRRFVKLPWSLLLNVWPRYVNSDALHCPPYFPRLKTMKISWHHCSTLGSLSLKRRWWVQSESSYHGFHFSYTFTEQYEIVSIKQPSDYLYTIQSVTFPLFSIYLYRNCGILNSMWKLLVNFTCSNLQNVIVVVIEYTCWLLTSLSTAEQYFEPISLRH